MGKRDERKTVEENKKEKRIGRTNWSAEGIYKFRVKIKMVKMGEKNVNEEIEIVIGKVKTILEDTVKKEVSEGEKRGNWAEEWK